MSLLHSPKYSLHQNVSYRNEEGKNTPCHRRATLDLGWVNKAGKNQSKSFYQPNPKPRAFPVVCKAEGEPGGATQGGQAGTPHPSEHGTSSLGNAWNAAGNPPLPQGSDSLALGGHGRAVQGCRCLTWAAPHPPRAAAPSTIPHGTARAEPSARVTATQPGGD